MARIFFHMSTSVYRRRENSLVMLDDVFPNLLSGFRVAEFNCYLREFPGSKAVSSRQFFPTASGQIGYEFSHAEYATHYPDLAGRVHLLEQTTVDADLAYLVFLNNGAKFLPLLTQTNTPFLITIYPGGGLQLNDPASDQKLAQVLGSPLCRGVITTQRATRDYLLAKQFIGAEKITHVFGLVTPEISTEKVERLHFGRDKQTLDIVFAAHRYTMHGIDKGYDLFIEAARQVVAKTEHVRFHVVGPWHSDGYPTDGIPTDRLTFYPVLGPGDLQTVFRYCDMIVSPNRPGKLAAGAFDGFPLGSCVDAGLQGAAVLASNEMHEDAFTDGKELIVVQPDADDVAQKILALADDPEGIARLGTNAMQAFRETYSFDSQLGPRLALIRKHLSTVAG